MDNCVFREDLIWVNEEYSNKEDLFRVIGSRLYELGIVKDSFVEGLIQREMDYPTGLPTMPYAIAIPHTDSIHVNNLAVGFVKLKEPIKFYNMGNKNLELDVHFVFVLCLKKAEYHMKILTSLIQMFQDNETMKELKELNDVDSIYKFFTSKCVIELDD